MATDAVPPRRPPQVAAEPPASAAWAIAGGTGPLVSVLVPVHQMPLGFLAAAPDSLAAQTCPSWEACIAHAPGADEELARLLEDRQRADPRIRPVCLESNDGISAATHAALVAEVRALRPRTDGAQAWDIFFRVAEKARRVIRVPGVHYRWRLHQASTSLAGTGAKPHVPAAQPVAIQEHLDRLHLPARVEPSPESGFQIHWRLPDETPVHVVLDGFDPGQTPADAFRTLCRRLRRAGFRAVVEPRPRITIGPGPLAAVPPFDPSVADPAGTFAEIRDRSGVPLVTPPSCYEPTLLGGDPDARAEQAALVRALCPDAFAQYQDLRRPAESDVVVSEPLGGTTGDPLQAAPLAAMSGWARGSRQRSLAAAQAESPRQRHEINRQHNEIVALHAGIRRMHLRLEEAALAAAAPVATPKLRTVDTVRREAVRIARHVHGAVGHVAVRRRHGARA